MSRFLSLLALLAAGCTGQISGGLFGEDPDEADGNADRPDDQPDDGPEDPIDAGVGPGGELDLFTAPVSTAEVDYPPVTHGLTPTGLWGDIGFPRPTNAWWQNLVLGQGGSPIMLLPYLTKALPDRLSVCAPKLVATADFVLSNFEDNLSIGASETLTSHVLTGYDDLSATVRWNAGGGSMSAPLVRGMAYATVDYAGLTPQLTTIHAILSVNGEGTRFDVSLNNGQRWLIYSSAPIALVRDGNRLVASAPFTGTLRAAIVPDEAAVAVLDAHAAAVPRGGKVTATSKDDEARLRFDWQSDGEPLIYAMPHHRAVLEDAELTGLELRSIRGPLVAVSGKAWTLVEALPTITWNAPRPIAANRRADVAAALQEDVAKVRPVAGDPYFFGKQIAALTRLAVIADELGDAASASTARAAATAALAPWLGEGGGKLVYDRTWGGVLAAGSQNDPGAAFGAGYYNDHHFHYGYFLYAAAALAKADKAWATANKPALDALVRDIAEPSGKDPHFPRFRTMDWYEGHSWAAGLFEFADSRNQESTSEAVNAWYGLSLYGLAIGDARLRDLGRLMLATEIRGARTYWQIQSGDDIYPAEYAARKVVGVLWGDKVDHATFFGSNLEFIHVIQMMPFTPISELLVSRSWLSESYPILSTVLGRGTPALETSWRGLIYAAHAILDADAAWTESQSLPSYDDGSSRTNQLYWIATRP